MTISEAIKAALKTKYKQLGFSQKAIDGVADYLEKTVTEEDQIETAISGVEGLLKAFQADFDKLRTENTALKKPKEDSTPKPEDKKEDSKPEGGAPDIAQIVAAAIAKAVEPLTAEINGMKAGNTAKSRRAALELALKDVPEKLKAKALKDFDRMNFDSDEIFDAFVQETATDLADYVQTSKENEAAGSNPLIPTGNIADSEVSPVMKNILKQRADAQAAQAKTA